MCSLQVKLGPETFHKAMAARALRPGRRTRSAPTRLAMPAAWERPFTAQRGSQAARQLTETCFSTRCELGLAQSCRKVARKLLRELASRSGSVFFMFGPNSVNIWPDRPAFAQLWPNSGRICSCVADSDKVHPDWANIGESSARV